MPHTFPARPQIHISGHQPSSSLPTPPHHLHPQLRTITTIPNIKRPPPRQYYLHRTTPQPTPPINHHHHHHIAATTSPINTIPPSSPPRLVIFFGPRTTIPATNHGCVRWFDAAPRVRLFVYLTRHKVRLVSITAPYGKGAFGFIHNKGAFDFCSYNRLGAFGLVYKRPKGCVWLLFIDLGCVVYKIRMRLVFGIEQQERLVDVETAVGVFVFVAIAD
uniref:Uncharacterized protein n=1 Tax=Tanacetum cinerariifolium TaxID=118510 RepID=A0A6L2LEP1_TANCI|nr:hypothetical protein [Tanacetum cinerariifolium]